jgi:hypothetical protein
MSDRAARRRALRVRASTLLAFASAGRVVHPGPLLAQAPAPARDAVQNANAWLMYFGDHALGRSRWALHAEAQVRRAELGRTWQQLLVRPGLTYTVTPQARLTGGYAWIDTHEYGEQPAAARFPEHRLWQQLTVTHPTGRVAWSHRYRVEQRWVGIMDPATDARTGWRYSNRVRYLGRASLPLRGSTIAVGTPYLTAYDELFVSAGRQVRNNVFDQNRAYAAVGWRLAPTLRLEAGYLHQLILKPSGAQMEHNHTVQVGFFSGAAIR